MMHNHFEDMFGAIEFGAAARTHHKIAVDGGSGGTSVPAPKAHDSGRIEPNTAPAGRPGPVLQVREAIKDGKVDKVERTAFDAKPAAVSAAVGKETDRLTSAVIKAHGNDLKRDASGRLELEDGAPVVDEESAAKATKYEQVVQELGDTKQSASLGVLSGQIKDLRSSGATDGLETLIAQRNERRSAEALVVGGVQDKLSLVGALGAQRRELVADAPKLARNDYEQLRTRADRWIEQFNDNGGRFDDSESFFSDIAGKITGGDHKATEVDFDVLAERFHESPEALEKFAGAQGLRDSDLQGKSSVQVQAYLDDLDDPSEAEDVAMRFVAAQRLENIFTTYNETRDVVDGTSDDVKAINTEIKLLNGAIEAEADVLSMPSFKKFMGALDNNPAYLDRARKTAGGGAVPASELTAEERRQSRDVSPKGKDGEVRAGGGRVVAGSGAIEPGPGQRKVEIDYTDPKYAAKVLDQAQQGNLLPGQHVEFDKQGKAVYTVQPGDSYWAISDQSDGKGANGFDTQHFLDNLNVNSQRLGRDPQIGIIHPNERVIIQNRSLDQLIKLLELPLHELIDVPSHMQRPGLQEY